MIGSLAQVCEYVVSCGIARGLVVCGQRLARFAGVAEPSKEGIKPINGGVSVVVKQAAVPR
jgi:hypothetical protein